MPAKATRKLWTVWKIWDLFLIFPRRIRIVCFQNITSMHFCLAVSGLINEKGAVALTIKKSGSGSFLCAVLGMILWIIFHLFYHQEKKAHFNKPCSTAWKFILKC
jgi:hypothetical protein